MPHAQVKVTDRRSSEETGQNGLAGIHRVEYEPPSRVAQSQPAAHFQTDLTLVTSDKFLRRPLVALAYPAGAFRGGGQRISTPR